MRRTIELNMDVFLAVVSILGIVAAVAGVGWVVLRLSRRPPEPASKPAPPPADPATEDEIWRWAAATPEIHRIWPRVGASVPVELEVRELLAAFKDLLEVSVSDPRTLQRALRDALQPVADEPEALARARRSKADDPLLRDLLAAAPDRQTLEAVFSRYPIDRPVPFIEEVPVLREDGVFWRLPMEVRLVARQPRDRRVFARHLTALDTLVHRADLDRPPEAVRRLLSALERLGRDLVRDRAYLPRTLGEVESAARFWLYGSQPASTRVERDRLWRVLAELVRARRIQGHGDNGFFQTGQAPVDALRKVAREYLEAVWMHAPRLTQELLAQLLHAELPNLPGHDVRPLWDRYKERPPSPREIVRTLRDEVSSGAFDPPEAERRLRALEDRGFLVHSLVHGLLRLERREAGVSRDVGFQGREQRTG